MTKEEQIHNLKARVLRRDRQVDVLREALEFYGNSRSYRPDKITDAGQGFSTPVDSDVGDIARSALKETQE